MLQDERDITYTVGWLLEAASTVNKRHGGGLGTFLLENLQIRIDTSWAGELGCGGHHYALIALADPCCNFRLCPIYAQGQTVDRWMASPDYEGRPRTGLGEMVALMRSGKVKPLRAPE